MSRTKLTADQAKRVKKLKLTADEVEMVRINPDLLKDFERHQRNMERHNRQAGSGLGRRAAGQYLRRRKCEECGKTEPMFARSSLCKACRLVRRREQQASAASWRRTKRPRIELGLAKIENCGDVSLYVELDQECKYCKQKFRGQRITAKYCSDLCRVYAAREREKKAGAKAAAKRKKKAPRKVARNRLVRK